MRRGRRLFDVKLAAGLNSEARCVAYLERVLWNGSAYCPRCGERERIDGRGVSAIKNRERKVVPARLFSCSNCRLQFTVLSGTFLRRTHINLRKWFQAIDAVFNSPEISIRTLQKKLGTSFKTAWAIRGIVGAIPEFRYDNGVVAIAIPALPRKQRRWIHPQCFRLDRWPH